MDKRWKMNRLGLIDFWYYTNEVFDFDDGHMLLRGSNGSGKSVTMQSFIPLLLDGNRSSERLDPFGTRSRKLENYLIDENSSRDDRIGYLYLEFKHGDRNLYKTIGLGMHARKNRPLDVWYFVIDDNRRIGEELQLWHNGLAITKQQLRNLIGNQFLDRQSDYLARVNQSIFGFNDLNEYKEMINLLLQLRTPKLSNSLKPTKINEILSNSLQPLSEDELRPMSEAIANMDLIKDQLDALKISFSGAKNIQKIYHQYNQALLIDKYQKFNAHQKIQNKTNKTLERLNQSIQDTMIYQVDLSKQEQDLKNEQKILMDQRATLANDDLISLSQEVMTIKTELENDQLNYEQKQEATEQKEERLIDLNQKYRNKKDELEHDEKLINKNLEELNSLNEFIDFDEHIVLKQEFVDKINHKYDFSYSLKRLNQNLEILKTGIKKVHEYQRLNDRLESSHDSLARQQNQQGQWQQAQIQLEQKFAYSTDDYLVTLSEWNEQNEVLKIDSQMYLQLVSLVKSYDGNPTYQAINRLINELNQTTMTKLLDQQNDIKYQRNEIDVGLKQKQAELQTYLDEQVLKPAQSKAVKLNRSYLDEQQIKYIPLYEVLDFSDECSQEQRDELEQLLLRNNLLDALLVSNENRELLLSKDDDREDNYIFIDHELDQLEICKLKDYQDLQNYLKQLGVREDDDLAIFDHSYRQGYLYGTLKSQTAVYIGSDSRNKYRQKMISEITQQIDDLQGQINELDEQLNEIVLKLDKLKMESTELPEFTELNELLKSLATNEEALKQGEAKLLEIKQEIADYQGDLQVIKQEIYEIMDQLGVKIKVSLLEELRDHYLDYQQVLNDLMVNHNNYLNGLDSCSSYQIQIDENQDDLDNQRGELSYLSNEIKIKQGKLQTKQQRLDEAGFEQIAQQLEALTKRLNALPQEIEAVVEAKGTVKSKLATLNEQINDNNELLKEQELITKQYFDVLVNEAKLQYVVELLPESSILEQLASQLNLMEEVKVNDLQVKLMESFNKNSGSLLEYNPTIIQINESELEDIDARIDLVARFSGKKISFKELLHNLSQVISDTEILLSETDQELFQDILVNNISLKIRQHIQNSQVWVTKINDYIKKMNTSSGLKLNLDWKSIKAQNDDELDTKVLVDLLQRDANLLKKSDLDKLSAHFRSKIETARAISSRDSETKSFHLVMKEVMDYRNWFEFKIFYQKPNETKKELTNNQFFAFSGGEKAMSMYIPLFSAVAAKFTGGNDDAPLIIALDEAFAGVDERNINNMFELIANFKFDYIMNSQILWGDYPAVKHLAIYELYRPENAHYVTVIAYRWNGKVKKMVG